MIKLITEQEDKRNKTYPLKEGTIAEMDNLKEKTNSEDWEDLFTKIISLAKIQLEKELKK